MQFSGRLLHRLHVILESVQGRMSVDVDGRWSGIVEMLDFATGLRLMQDGFEYTLEFEEIGERGKKSGQIHFTSAGGNFQGIGRIVEKQ